MFFQATRELSGQFLKYNLLQNTPISPLREIEREREKDKKKVDERCHGYWIHRINSGEKNEQLTYQINRPNCRQSPFIPWFVTTKVLLIIHLLNFKRIIRSRRISVGSDFFTVREFGIRKRTDSADLTSDC